MLRKLVATTTAALALTLTACDEDDGNNEPQNETEISIEVEPDDSGGNSITASITNTTTIPVGDGEAQIIVTAEAELDSTGRLTGRLDGDFSLMQPINEYWTVTYQAPLLDLTEGAVTFRAQTSNNVNFEATYNLGTNGFSIGARIRF